MATIAKPQVRTLLADLFLGLGPEVFLLCTFAAPITKLTTVIQQGLLPDLGKWWKRVSHPRGLTEVANKLCETSLISTLISSNPLQQNVPSELHSTDPAPDASDTPVVQN